MYATVAISQYLFAPRKGQMSNINNIYGYLKKYIFTSIKFNIEIPTYDNFKTIEGSWGNLYYGELEYIPHSFQPPIVKPVLISLFVYANLIADLTTRIYSTGIIHLLSKTPIEWYSK